MTREPIQPANSITYTEWIKSGVALEEGQIVDFTIQLTRLARPSSFNEIDIVVCSPACSLISIETERGAEIGIAERAFSP